MKSFASRFLRFWPWIIAAIGIIMFLSEVIASPDRWTSALPTLIWPAIFLCIPWLNQRQLKRRYQQECGVKGTLHLVIDGTGVDIKSANSEGKLLWGGFQRLVEDEGTILLYQSSFVINMIPKRAFASGAELESFRQLAREKIPGS